MIESLEQWRQNEQLAGWAFKVFNSAEWELLMKIMEREQHVRHFKQDCEGIQKLGRIEGWDLCIKRIAQFAQGQNIADLGEPKFEPPDAPEQNPA